MVIGGLAALAIHAPAMAQDVRRADALVAVAEKIDLIAEPQKGHDAWAAATAALKAEKTPRKTAIAAAMKNRGDTLLTLSRVDDAIAEAEAARKLLDDSRDAKMVLAGLFTVLGNASDGKSAWQQAADYHRQAVVLKRSLYGADSPEVALSEADLGLELTKLSQYDEATKLLEHSFATLDNTRPAADASRLVSGTYLANIHYHHGDLAGSEKLLRRLIEDGRPLGAAHPVMAQLTSQLAANLAALGRLSDAMVVHRNSIAALMASDTNKSTLADAQMGATIASLQIDRPAETEAFGAAAAANFAAFGQQLSSAAALTQAANAARQLDKPDVALERATSAVAMAEALPQPVPLATALFRGTLALAQAANGKIPEALATQKAALELIAKTRPLSHAQRTYAEIEMGWLTALAGDPTAGIARAKPVIESIVQRNRNFELARTRVVPPTGNLESFGQAIEAAWLAKDRDFGFYLAQVLVESDAGRATLATLARLSARDAETAKRLDRRRELLASKLDLDSERLAKLADTAAADALAKRITAIDAEVATIQVALERDFPGFETLLRPDPEAIGAVQARLARGEVLVVPVTTYHGFYTLALTRDRFAWGRSPLSRTGVRALIERIRAGLLPIGTIRAGEDASSDVAITPTAFDRAAAAELYAAIFTPEVATLVGKAKLLSIAPDDLMSAIPFSLLPMGSSANAPWLIEKLPLRVVPAIAALGRGEANTAAVKDFVGVGAPIRTGASADASALVKAIDLLPPLPGAASELKAMASAVGASSETLLTGTAATETRLRAADLKSARILAFATHGLVSGDFDVLTEPALLLTPDPSAGGTAGDGLLTASEAATLPLNADWIVLSACNTAAGDSLSASGYSGLARAFLFAGGRQVLASHWPVRDDVSARLTVETIRASRGGADGPQALRSAMLKLMRDPKLAGAANPALWAPYMVVSR